MNDKKSLWEILKGSLVGVDGLGSNKRVASFYIITVILTGMMSCFLYAYIYAVHLKNDANSTMYILKTFMPLFNTFIIFLSVLLGLASVEQITNIFKILRGQKVDDAPSKTKEEASVTTTTTTKVETPQA